MPDNNSLCFPIQNHLMSLQIQHLEQETLYAVMDNFTDNVKKPAFFQRYEAFFSFDCSYLPCYVRTECQPFAAEKPWRPLTGSCSLGGGLPFRVTAPQFSTERSDILDSQLPAWITLKEQVWRGESPLWYPNGAGGQPISLSFAIRLSYCFYGQR